MHSRPIVFVSMRLRMYLLDWSLNWVQWKCNQEAQYKFKQ